MQQERVASGESVISIPISGVIDLTLDEQESNQPISTLSAPIFESYRGNSFLHNWRFQESTELRIPGRPAGRGGPHRRSSRNTRYRFYRTQPTYQTRSVPGRATNGSSHRRYQRSANLSNQYPGNSSRSFNISGSRINRPSRQPRYFRPPTAEEFDIA